MSRRMLSVIERIQWVTERYPKLQYYYIQKSYAWAHSDTSTICLQALRGVLFHSCKVWLFFLPLPWAFWSYMRAEFLEEKTKRCLSQESPLRSTSSGVWFSLLTTMKGNFLISGALKVNRSVCSTLPFRCVIQRHYVWFSIQQQKLVSTREQTGLLSGS